MTLVERRDRRSLTGIYLSRSTLRAARRCLALALCVLMAGCFGGTTGITLGLLRRDKHRDRETPSPAVTDVTRGYAPFSGGNVARILGKNFGNPVEVYFAGAVQSAAEIVDEPTDSEILVLVPASMFPFDAAAGGERQVWLKVVNPTGKESLWPFWYKAGSIRGAQPTYGLAQPGSLDERTVVRLRTRLFRLSTLLDGEPSDGELRGVYVAPQGTSDPYDFDVDAAVKLAADDFLSSQEDNPDQELYRVRMPPRPAVGSVSIVKPFNIVIVSENGRDFVPFGYAPPFPPENVRAAVQWNLGAPDVLLQWTENAYGPPTGADPEENQWPPHEPGQDDTFTRVEITRRPLDPTLRAPGRDLRAQFTVARDPAGATERAFTDTTVGDAGIFAYDLAGVIGSAPEYESVSVTVTAFVVPLTRPFHLVWDPAAAGTSTGAEQTSGAALAVALRNAGQEVFYFAGSELAELRGDGKIFGAAGALNPGVQLAAIWVCAASSVTQEVLTATNAEILLSIAGAPAPVMSGVGYGTGLYFESRTYWLAGQLARPELDPAARELLTACFGVTDNVNTPYRQIQVTRLTGEPSVAWSFGAADLLSTWGEPALPELIAAPALQAELQKESSAAARKVLAGTGKAADESDRTITAAYVRTYVPEGQVVPHFLIASTLDFRRIPTASEERGSRDELVHALLPLLQGVWEPPLPVPVPVVTNVTPASAPCDEGTPVRIDGTNLDRLTRVTLWNTILWDSAVQGPANGEQLLFSMPPVPAPVAAFVKVLGEGGAIAHEFVFDYTEGNPIPRVDSVSPTEASCYEEVLVSVYGHHLDHVLRIIANESVVWERGAAPPASNYLEFSMPATYEEYTQYIDILAEMPGDGEGRIERIYSFELYRRCGCEEREHVRLSGLVTAQEFDYLGWVELQSGYEYPQHECIPEVKPEISVSGPHTVYRGMPMPYAYGSDLGTFLSIGQEGREVARYFDYGNWGLGIDYYQFWDALMVLEPVALVRPQAGSGLVFGVIKDLTAAEADGVDGLRVRLRPGINNQRGEAATTTTYSREWPGTAFVTRGYYEFRNLPPGCYTAEVAQDGDADCDLKGDGFMRTFFTFSYPGTNVEKPAPYQLPDQHVSPSLCAYPWSLDTPESRRGAYRIVLTWKSVWTGESSWTPNLDSNLTGPSCRFKICPSCPYQIWCADVVEYGLESGGLEYTTILKEERGTYRFWVENNDGSAPYCTDALSFSHAQVKVFRADGGVVATFNVPPEQCGNYWWVFSMEDGVITPVNSIEQAPMEELPEGVDDNQF